MLSPLICDKRMKNSVAANNFLAKMSKFIDNCPPFL